MLFVFLLDTSASMYQRCNNGLTLLDCAKGAIEHFHKLRLRDPLARVDRYMLVTCDNGYNAIKVIDKFPFTNFLHVLKVIQARNLTDIGGSMQCVFSFLHLQHLVADIDRFGQGRNLCSIDPTILLLLTDGTELTSLSGVLPYSLQTLLPNEKVQVGSDLVKQLIRWDQRIFSMVLRIPSMAEAILEKSGISSQGASLPNSEWALSLDGAISALCETTGGKYFVATSWKVLLQHVESLASHLAPTVVVSFELMQVPGSVSLPPQVHAACQQKIMLVRVGQMQGHWPIPESYFPDPSHPEFQPRDPHPLISCKSVDADAYIPSNFIYDKYEVENSPFMGMPLKGLAGACWQVFMHNSKGSNHGLGDPFGFIRLNHGGTLTLFLLPYNYPVLWQLLKLAMKPSGSASAKVPQIPQWRQDIERYCSSIPVYYLAPLRIALKRWGLHGHLVADSMDNSWLTGFVASQLKKVKIQAKMDLDAAMASILTDDHFVGCSVSLSSPTLCGRTLPVNVAASSQKSETSSTGSDGHSKNLLNISGIAPSFRHFPSDQASYTKGYDSISIGTSASFVGQSVLGISQSSGYPNQGQGNALINDSTLSGSNDSIKVSVFKNPFDVPMEKLLRQLIQFPIRVASSFDVSRNRGIKMCMNQSISSLRHLAARVAATEENEARHTLPIEKMGDFNEALLKQQPPRNPFADDMDRNKQLRSMFGNPYRQEKNDGVDEAWQEGTSRPLPRGRKRRCRPEFIGPIQSTSVTSSEGSIETISSNEFASMAKALPETQEKDMEMVRSTMSAPISRLKAVGNISTEEQDVKYTLDNLTAGKERIEVSPGDTAEMEHDHLEEGEQEAKATLLEHATVPSQSRLMITTSTGVKKNQHEVATVIVTAIRLLRHAKPGHTHKLFEMLSHPDFPVDKCNFLEQLVEQAHRYNKGTIAKELLDYQNQLKYNDPPGIPTL